MNDLTYDGTKITVLKFIELHPINCRCYTCEPSGPAKEITACGPSSSLWTSLSDDQDPPEGWRRI